MFATIESKTEYFLSEDHQITVDGFIPADEQKHPAVLALHGSGGGHLSTADPARMLAGMGFAVFVLHYFDRTKTVWADDRTIRIHFQTWMKTIADALTFISAQPRVDADRMALLGFSLGAYLGLSVATQDARVKAVVDFFGGLPPELTHHVRHLPPVLILHGEADARVPVGEAHRLQKVLEARQTPYEMKLYPGAGHGFDPPTMMDAVRRALNFLNRTLRNGDS